MAKIKRRLSVVREVEICGGGGSGPRGEGEAVCAEVRF